MDGWEGLVDAGASTDENVHNSSAYIIGIYHLGRSIVATGTQDVRAWFFGMGQLMMSGMRTQAYEGQ